MPRTRRSKKSNNKRSQPQSEPTSPANNKKRRANGTSPSHLNSSDAVNENEERTRVEEYEEEGIDLVESDGDSRIDMEDRKEKDVASISDSNSSSPSKKRKKESPRFDYGNIDLETMTELDERPLRIYLDGVFDMTHFGHFRVFKSVRDKFPNCTIVVGVAGDEDTSRLKGQTVLNEKERAETISHCKWVDEVVCPCPWIVTQPFLDEYKLDYIAHDAAPYVSAGADDIYKFVKDQGRFIATQRTEGISTTGLINRIVRQYNEYVIRNLKRGVPRQDLNVSWTRMQRIRAEQTLKENAQFMAENLKKFTEDPDEFISGFLAMFGPGGRIRQKFTEKIVEMREEFVEYAQFAPM